MIIIYSLVGCPFCEEAENLIVKMNLPHKIIKVKTQKDKDIYKRKHQMNTYPHIFFKTKRGIIIKIGGYEEFRNLVNNV